MKTIYIYVLALEGGNFYIGQTNNFKRRAQRHAGQTASQWTKLHAPIGFAEFIEPSYTDDSTAAKRETEITLRYMHEHGWRKVRGGTYCFVDDAEVLFHLQRHGHFLEEPPLSHARVRENFYAVARGRQTGIFRKWSGAGEAQEQIERYSGAIYKKFHTFEEAENWLQLNQTDRWF